MELTGEAGIRFRHRQKVEHSRFLGASGRQLTIPTVQDIDMAGSAGGGTSTNGLHGQSASADDLHDRYTGRRRQFMLVVCQVFDEYRLHHGSNLHIARRGLRKRSALLQDATVQLMRVEFDLRLLGMGASKA